MPGHFDSRQQQKRDKLNSDVISVDIVNIPEVFLYSDTPGSSVSDDYSHPASEKQKIKNWLILQSANSQQYKCNIDILNKKKGYINNGVNDVPSVFELVLAVHDRVVQKQLTFFST